MSDDSGELCDQITDEQPTGERWDPLGANDLDDEIENITNAFELCTTALQCPSERVRALEEEQELLNASLFQLTTHFAQVQFRLRQVVDAPSCDKEHLLKSLEEFAFRGVNDPCPISPKIRTDRTDYLLQRQKQLELVEQLKSQLTELESYTYKSKSDPSWSPSSFLEQQRVIIDELRQKIFIGDDRSEGDGASALTPVNMKEQLVNQFKTQIADLERFIQFLQESGSQYYSNTNNCTCKCPRHSFHGKLDCHFSELSKDKCATYSPDDEVRNRTIGIMKRAAMLLQMFIVMQFGCGTEHFKKNNLKPCFNHWGDMRARLEIAVARIEEIMQSKVEEQGEYTSDVEDSGQVSCDTRITTIVRKNLATAIRDLMQHGLVEIVDKTTIVPYIMCFSSWQHQSGKKMHVWEIILQYYHLKNGETYNSTPARKLSLSFNLDISNGTGGSQQHTMLSTIGTIITTHTKYKRSYDAHFKAFICAALNANKLVSWLSMILQCRHILNNCYNSWSYVIRTGFQDSLQSLDRLTPYHFDLPVDLAVRHFQNIKDVFM